MSETTSNNEQCHPNEVLWCNFVNVHVLLHIPEVNVDMHAHRLQESFLLFRSGNEMTFTAEMGWKKLCLIPSLLLYACSKRTSGDEDEILLYSNQPPVSPPRLDALAVR